MFFFGNFKPAKRSYNVHIFHETFVSVNGENYSLHRFSNFLKPWKSYAILGMFYKSDYGLN